jgi:hypothetical protein
MSEFDSSLSLKIDSLTDLIRGVEPLSDFARSTQLHRVAAESSDFMELMDRQHYFSDLHYKGVMRIIHGSGTEALLLQPKLAVCEYVSIKTGTGTYHFPQEVPVTSAPDDGRQCRPWHNDFESILGFKALVRAKIRIAEVTLDPRFLDQATYLLDHHSPNLGSEGPSKNLGLLQMINSTRRFLDRAQEQVRPNRKLGDELSPDTLDERFALSFLEDLYWAFR